MYADTRPCLQRPTCSPLLAVALAGEPKQFAADLQRSHDSSLSSDQRLSGTGWSQAHPSRRPAYAPEFTPQEESWNLLKWVELKNVVVLTCNTSNWSCVLPKNG